MRLFSKWSVLLLCFMNICMRGNGDLMITNTTSGLLKITVSRKGEIVFTSSAISPGQVYINTGLLGIGEEINFKPADNTVGPVLPSHTVGSIAGRAADVTINCKSDQCDITET